MARNLSDPLLPDFGAIEGANRYSRSRHLVPEDIAHSDRQAIPTIGHVSPDPVPHDVRVDYAALDRPTVLRRAESAPWWSKLPRGIRVETREFVIERLEKLLLDARAEAQTWVCRDPVVHVAPPLHLLEMIAELERCLEMVRGW